jgi:hypothetical protein
MIITALVSSDINAEGKIVNVLIGHVGKDHEPSVSYSTSAPLPGPMAMIIINFIGSLLPTTLKISWPLLGISSI